MKLKVCIILATTSVYITFDKPRIQALHPRVHTNSRCQSKSPNGPIVHTPNTPMQYDVHANPTILTPHQQQLISPKFSQYGTWIHGTSGSMHPAMTQPPPAMQQSAPPQQMHQRQQSQQLQSPTQPSTTQQTVQTNVPSLQDSQALDA